MNDTGFNRSRLVTLMAMPVKELHELIDRNVSYIKVGDLSGGDMSPLAELRRVGEVMSFFQRGINPLDSE